MPGWSFENLTEIDKELKSVQSELNLFISKQKFQIKVSSLMNYP